MLRVIFIMPETKGISLETPQKKMGIEYSPEHIPIQPEEIPAATGVLALIGKTQDMRSSLERRNNQTDFLAFDGGTVQVYRFPNRFSIQFDLKNTVIVGTSQQKQ